MAGAVSCVSGFIFCTFSLKASRVSSSSRLFSPVLSMVVCCFPCGQVSFRGNAHGLALRKQFVAVDVGEAAVV